MLISKDALYNAKIGAKGERLAFLRQIEILISMYDEAHFVNERDKLTEKLTKLIELEKRSDPHRKNEVSAEIKKVKKHLENLNFILCK